MKIELKTYEGTLKEDTWHYAIMDGRKFLLYRDGNNVVMMREDRGARSVVVKRLEQFDKAFFAKFRPVPVGSIISIEA